MNPDEYELSGKAQSLDQIVELAVTGQTITVDTIMNRTTTPSRRSVRRAIKEAEALGWVEKASPDANSWYPGEKALQHRVVGRYDDVDVDLPRMFFGTSSKVPDSFLYNEDVMVSAGVAWRNDGAGFSIGVPDARCLYVDSGGFQASVYFQDEYPYLPGELHGWADRIGAQVVFGMDWACEDAEVLAENADGVEVEDILPVDERIEKSFTDQLDQFRVYQQGRYGHRFAPVVQGRDPGDYVEFAKRLDESDMPTDGLVGVGTVCKRHKVDEIHAVVEAIADVLPKADLHLFGATLDVWKDDRFRGLFYSSDTTAWLYHGPQEFGFAKGEDREIAYETYKEKVEAYRPRVAPSATR